ncbi:MULTISPECIES: hypothetical protein [unclassified Streptomyces]|uniref:hypothetical protein n=1 Tax=unclassified Streptomyces TaxID=2593676 RepID=UPI00190CE8C4|nr:MULTISPECIES: hypothetical protein [unclassified Streptomyces]MBK3563186.1 hypothetical protein [Streptomyces sp. MBT62]MBK6013175.1 hypothetical protein [Streptomyces sp. MBT53]
MSAYSTVYQALTSSRALRPDEAAQMLGSLRREFGQELADAVERTLDGQYRRAETDTDAEFRRKRRKFGAAIRTLNLVREFATNPRGFTTPAQRDSRSTP